MEQFRIILFVIGIICIMVALATAPIWMPPRVMGGFLILIAILGATGIIWTILFNLGLVPG